MPSSQVSDNSKINFNKELNDELFFILNWFRKYSWFRHGLIFISSLGLMLVLIVHIIAFGFIKQVDFDLSLRKFLNILGLWLFLVFWFLHHLIMFIMINQIAKIKKNLGVKPNKKKYDNLPNGLRWFMKNKIIQWGMLIIGLIGGIILLITHIIRIYFINFPLFRESSDVINGIAFGIILFGIFIHHSVYLTTNFSIRLNNKKKF